MTTTPTPPARRAYSSTPPATNTAGHSGGHDDLVSSARTATIPPNDHAAGTIALGAQRISESAAREILDRVFRRAGIAMQNDYPFRIERTMLSLDGYDPVAKVGYQFVAHADADVVTDFDTSAESALRELDRAGKVRLFIVHDGDVRDLDELQAMASEFIDDLDLTSPQETRPG